MAKGVQRIDACGAQRGHKRGQHAGGQERGYRGRVHERIARRDVVTGQPLHQTAEQRAGDGRSGADPRGIDALRTALYRGEWWAPLRTARLRLAAARALHATASPAGDAVLAEASTAGPRGVRKAASEAMSAPRRARPAGGPS